MSRRYVRRSGLVRRDVNDELMLFDPRDDSMHVLNAAAAVLWERLAEPATVEVLVGAIEESFEVEPGVDVAADVRRALSDLETRGLVMEPAESP